MPAGEVFNFPVKVTWGTGQCRSVFPLIEGQRVCLVISPHLAGLESELISRLVDGAQLLIAPASNPTIEDLRNDSTCWSEIAPYCDVIVAVGGGSAIDFAKALAASAGNVEGLLAQLKSGKPMAMNALPLIAIPTTAGTGSEVTPWATIWDPAARQKLSLHSANGWARHAIVDPELLNTCPHDVALASALDALSHALESVWNHHANPVSDALAFGAASGIIRHLPEWLEERSDIARNAISRSALLAGMAFSQTRTALAHALSYDITLVNGTPHGIACSFSLPEVWRRAVLANPARMALLEPLFGTLSHEPLAAFLSNVGIDTRFESYGISDTDLAITRVLDSVRGRNFIGVTPNV
jgi:hypothetical protein